MSIHYKFKSHKDFSTVTFDGIHISVADLKKEILEQKHIPQSADFDLQITNAQSGEVYEDEHSLIPKNTSVVVVRVPRTTEKRRSNGPGNFGPGGGGGQFHRPGGYHPRHPQPSAIQPSASALAKNVDLASMDLSEEEKIKLAMSQSTADYDPSKYQRVRQGGRVPNNFICKNCHKGGHWRHDCPVPNEHTDVKKATGIPRSFMVPVEGPSVPGAMMTPEGRYAVPAVDHAAYMEEKNKIAEPPPPKPKIPDELVCQLCDDLMTDALLVPCCANSYCDECIRKALLDSDSQECPSCHESGILPTSLIANRFLRTTVNKFKNETGYSKPLNIPIKKDPVVVVDLTDKKEDSQRRKLSLDELPDDLFPHSPRKVDPDDKENERQRHDDEEEKTDLYDFEGSIPSPFAKAAPESTEKEPSEQVIRTIGTIGTTTSYHPEPKYKEFKDFKEHHGPPPHPGRQFPSSRGSHHHHPYQRPPKEHYQKEQHYQKDQHYPKEHYQKEQHYPKEHYRHPKTPFQSGMPSLPSIHHSQQQQQQQPPPQQQHQHQPPPRSRPPMDRPPPQQISSSSEIHEPSPPGFTDVLPLPPGEDRIPTPTSRRDDHHDERGGRGDPTAREADGLPPSRGAAPLLPLPLLPLPAIPPFNPSQPPPGFPASSSAPPPTTSSSSSQQQQPPPSQQQQQPPPLNKSGPPGSMPQNASMPPYSGPPPNFPPNYPPSDYNRGGYPPMGGPPRERERRYPSRERSMRKLPPLREPRPRDPLEAREGAIIDDPLKEFERIMREKDRQKKMQPMRKRSRSRSFSPGRRRNSPGRSPSPFGKRSRSRSYSRSPSPKRKRPGLLRRRTSYSRSPSSRSPPRRHLRSRSRSRNRSLTPTSQLSKRRSPRRTAPPFSPSPPPRFPPRKDKDEFYDRQLRYDAPGGRYYPNNGANKPYPPRDFDPNLQKFEQGPPPPKYDKFDTRPPPREYPNLPPHVHPPPHHHHHHLPPHLGPHPDRGIPYRDNRNMRSMDREQQQQQLPPLREGLMGHRPPPPSSSSSSSSAAIPPSSTTVPPSSYDIMPPGTEGNGDQNNANSTPKSNVNNTSSSTPTHPSQTQQQPPPTTQQQQNPPSLFELEISPPSNYSQKSGLPPHTGPGGNIPPPGASPRQDSSSSYYSSHPFPNQPPQSLHASSHRDRERIRSRSREKDIRGERSGRESGRDRDIRERERDRERDIRERGRSGLSGRDYHHHRSRTERDRDHRDVRSGRDRERDVRSGRDVRDLRERETKTREQKSASKSLSPDSEIGERETSRSRDRGSRDRERDGKKRHVKKSRESSSERADKKDKKERKEKKKHKKKKEKEEKKFKKGKKLKSSGEKKGKSVSDDDQSTSGDEADGSSRRNSLTETTTTTTVTNPSKTNVDDTTIQETVLPIEATFVNIKKEDVSTTKENTSNVITGTPIPTIGNKIIGVDTHGHEIDSVNSNLTVIVCDSTVKSPDRTNLLGDLSVSKKLIGNVLTGAVVTSDQVDLKKTLVKEETTEDTLKGTNDEIMTVLHEKENNADFEKKKKNNPIKSTISKHDESLVKSEKILTEKLPSMDVSVDAELNVKEYDDTNKVEIPVSVPSKWDKFGEDDMDESNSVYSQKDEEDGEGKSYTDASGNVIKETTQKKVTSEVLKRAENALFHKAISAISTSNRSSSSTRKASPPPPTTTQSSSKRKVYVEKLEGVEKEKDDKIKDLDSRETRQKGSGFQVTLSSSATESSNKSESGKRPVRDRLGSKISDEHGSSRNRRDRSSSSRERDKEKGKDKNQVKSQVTAASTHRERDRRRRSRSKSPIRTRRIDRSSRSKSRDRGRIREKERARRSPPRKSRSRSPHPRSTSKTRRERLRGSPSIVRQKNRDKAPLELASSQQQPRHTSRSSSRENRRRSSSVSKRRSRETSRSRTTRGRDKEGGSRRSRELSPSRASSLTPSQTKSEKTEHEESWKKQADKFVPIGDNATGSGMEHKESVKTSDDEKDTFQTTPVPSLASRKQKGRINIKLSSTNSASKGDPNKSSSSSSSDDEHVSSKHESTSKPTKSSDSDEEKESKKRKKERKKAKRRRSESTSSSSSDDSAPRKSKKSKKKKKKSKKKKKAR